MHIPFRRVTSIPHDFDETQDGLNLKGNVVFMQRAEARLIANLKGDTNVQCYRCGDEFSLNINENLDFLVYDGVYKGEELDVIELEDSIVDFSQILQSEVESIKSDYHLCENCKDSD